MTLAEGIARRNFGPWDKNQFVTSRAIGFLKSKTLSPATPGHVECSLNTGKAFFGLCLGLTTPYTQTILRRWVAQNEVHWIGIWWRSDNWGMTGCTNSRLQYEWIWEFTLYRKGFTIYLTLFLILFIPGHRQLTLNLKRTLQVGDEITIKGNGTRQWRGVIRLEDTRGVCNGRQRAMNPLVVYLRSRRGEVLLYLNVTRLEIFYGIPTLMSCDTQVYPR